MYCIFQAAVPTNGTYVLSMDMFITKADGMSQYQIGVVAGGTHRDPSFDCHVGSLVAVDPSQPNQAIGNYNLGQVGTRQLVKTGTFQASAGQDLLVVISTNVVTRWSGVALTAGGDGIPGTCDDALDNQDPCEPIPFNTCRNPLPNSMGTWNLLPNRSSSSGSWGEPNNEIWIDNLQLNDYHITQWRAVRSHSGVGPVGIVLNATRSGNGSTGPTVETRGTTGLGMGLREVRVDFDGAVTLNNPAAITVTGRSTVGGIMQPPVGYSFTAAMLDPDTLQLLFNVLPLPPDESCYNITIGPGTLVQTIPGDVDCNLRALVGDGNMNGEIIGLSDALLAKNKIGQPVASWPHLDYNLAGGIQLSDALLAKFRIGKKALCP